MPKSLKDLLLNQRIKEIRPMAPAELAKEDWHAGVNGPPTVLVLENGTKIYPARDTEGNGPGWLFGEDADGTSYHIVVQ